MKRTLFLSILVMLPAITAGANEESTSADFVYTPDCGEGIYDESTGTLTINIQQQTAWLDILRKLSTIVVERGTESGSQKTTISIDSPYNVQVDCSLRVICTKKAWVVDSYSYTNYYAEELIPVMSLTGSGDITLQSDVYSYFSEVDNNRYMCGVQVGICKIDVPLCLYVTSQNGQFRPGEEHFAMNAAEAYIRGRLEFTQDLSVCGSVQREDAYGIHYTGLCVSEIETSAYYDDWDESEHAFEGKSLACVEGTTFRFKASTFSASDGDIRVVGIEAVCGDTLDDDLGMGYPYCHLSGDAVIGGEDQPITIQSDAGKAQFTGVYSVSLSDIRIDGGVTVSNVDVRGGQDATSLTAVKASTAATVSIGGKLDITNNTTSGSLYSLVASGGDITVATSAHHVEGDMKAGVGHHYLYYNSTTGHGPYGILPESDELVYWKIEESEIVGSKEGNITVSFSGDDAYFTGFTTVDATPLTEEDENGTVIGTYYSSINLSLTNGATWNVVPTNTPTPAENGCYESTVTSLHADGANIYIGTTADYWGSAGDLSRTSLHGTATDKPTQLRIGTLTGSGATFIMRAEITADTDRADHLILEQASEGTHYILVKGSGSGGKESMTDYLVQRRAGTAEFTLSNASGVVDIGVYNYGLKSRDTAEGKEWYLAKVELQPEPGPAPEPVISPTGEAVLALTSPSAQTALFLQNLSTLRQRLGEVRTCKEAAPADAGRAAGSNNEQPEPRCASQEFYARALAGHDTVPGYRGVDFRNNYWGAAVGYLRHINEQWLFGAEFNVVEGKQRLVRPNYTTKGESETYGILLSSTWYNDKGSYCDFVFGLDHYEQKLNTYMLDGTPVHGSFSALSPGISLEVGHKFMLGESKKWFVEPQAQLTFYHAGGDNFTTSNGMGVNRQDADSLTGRIGIVMGKTHREGNAKGLQWHVDVGVLHEFLDEAKATVNGEAFSASTLGTRIYYGLGGDYILNQRAQLYGYIGQEKGSDYESDYNARFGVRISF